MNRSFIIPLIACSLIVNLTAFANKGARYIPGRIPTDNLDWTKNWYIGAGINGNADFLMDNGGIDTFPTLTADDIELNNSNIGFDVYLGREISRFWTAEFGYSYIGNVNLDGEIDDERVVSATIRQWNLHLVGLGKLPIGKHFNFMVKGGTLWYYNSEKIHDLVLDEITHNNYRGFALTYGAGAEVYWDQFAVRGEYTVISPANNVQDDFYVTDIIGVSLIYKFI